MTEPENETTTRKAGRPVGAPNKKSGRGYKTRWEAAIEERNDLQARITTALRLLRRGGEGTLLPTMVAVAIETLEGK